MKSLMLTSAIVLVTMGAANAQQNVDEAMNVPGFRATDFNGMDLHTLSPDAIVELRAATPANPAWNERNAAWTSSDTFIAGRDQWENIGAINDIVLSQDGEVQGVLLDVGGFLGIGVRTVLVDFQDLYFVRENADGENLGDFFVVANLSREQLEALPEWDDENLAIGYAWDNGAAMDAAAPMGVADSAAPQIAAPMADTGLATPTAEELTGATVVDGAGNAIGSVSDLRLEGDMVTGAIIDVGGFLGMGAKPVLLPIDALSVVRNPDGTAMHVATSMTREQLEALPEHAQ
ncbi:PRC-barrel (plasmid) [Ketogulonicigenium vulgare WSH-001]|uniref:PRC-barrel n=2 Tax=Ketogulonicigenium vulgare TaxID=92945 RepID=F9YAW5_KETVW|nr:PRC-barrel [Ketogulonicigenium vulgare WSH-001]